MNEDIASINIDDIIARVNRSDDNTKNDNQKNNINHNNTIIKYVIGWDIKKGKAKPHGGLFGIPEAFGGAIAEQGQTTWHVHFIIYIIGFNDYQDKIF